MKNLKKKSIYTALILVAASFSLYSCNTTGPDDDHDEHDEPWGIALFQNGNEIARHFGSQVTYTGGSQLHIAPGEESPLTTVRFLDEEGHEFTPDDEEYSLSWEIEPAEHLEIEQHDEDGKWSFHLAGVTAGEAEVRFILLHGQDHPHEDFVSMPFEVHVE